jgi:hypothetical protein
LAHLGTHLTPDHVRTAARLTPGTPRLLFSLCFKLAFIPGYYPLVPALSHVRPLFSISLHTVLLFSYSLLLYRTKFTCEQCSLSVSDHVSNVPLLYFFICTAYYSCCLAYTPPFRIAQSSRAIGVAFSGPTTCGLLHTCHVDIYSQHSFSFLLS